MALTRADQEKLLTDAAREMEEAGEGTITIEYSIVQAMGLLGTLQLALRHPKNTGGTSRYMRELAMRLEAFLGACGPATSRLCRLGWDPTADAD